jgi:hypothetical protein
LLGCGGVRGFSWQFGRLDIQVVGSETSDRNETSSMAMIVMVSREMIILPEIPLGRRTNP